MPAWCWPTCTPRGSRRSPPTCTPAIPTDVADPMAMQQLAAAVPDVDLVCLNAGTVGTALGAPWEADPSEWDHLLAVNLGGVVNGLPAFVPRLLASARPGHILITASLAGLATFPGGGAYAATQHAVVPVAEQTALALADTSVGVTMLCPALAHSAMSPTGGDPADVADEALHAVHEGRFDVVPEAWQAAVLPRAEHLVRGQLPVPPHPPDRRHVGAVQPQRKTISPQ